MKHLLISLLAVLAITVSAISGTIDTLHFGRFGSVHLYGDQSHPKHVVLFVSGDGGWNLGVVDMARELAGQGSLVVGVNIIHYLAELAKSEDEYVYPASDFEALSQFVQKTLGLTSYLIPTLVGYSSGATLVYAVLVQAPSNTFRGAVSLGFCPDLEFPKPFLKGNGLQLTTGPKGKGLLFLPATTLKQPWIILEGDEDQVCNPQSTAEFVAKVPLGKIYQLAKVGHGFSVPRNWMPQFREAFKDIYASDALIKTPNSNSTDTSLVSVADLPLEEMVSLNDTAKTLVILYSGDGGWSGFTQDLAEGFLKTGAGVVGVNCLQYFWTKRTPDGAASDLSRILTHYLMAWNKEKVVLAGYSFGADVLPFMASRLTDDLKSRVAAIGLISPSKKADFEFHVTSWLNSSGSEALPVLPEVEKLRGIRIVAIRGDEEKESLCSDFPPNLARVVVLKGGHHLGGKTEVIVDEIMMDSH
jgi:type IV secretory pathway VirJ component